MNDTNTKTIKCGDIFRLCAALLIDEIELQTNRKLPLHETSTWTHETNIDEGGIGLDSLARIDFAVRLNKYFHLHEVGAEDYLLLKRTLGEWCEVIEYSLKIKSKRITFQTSGSTGTPKPCTHELAMLHQEVDYFSELISKCTRLIGFVPPHHIYGFLFTVLLPEKLGCVFEDARLWGPSSWPKKIQSGDTIIATPYIWGTLDKVCEHFPADVMGITSTAPMPKELKLSLQEKGLNSLVEIYGSSETAGIGYRYLHDEDYALLPYWRVAEDKQCLLRQTENQSEIQVALNDILDWKDETHFSVGKRRDDAVQIGGVNVFPAKVKRLLEEHPLIDECLVRPTCLSGDPSRVRLSAFIVLNQDNANLEQVREDIICYCQTHLSAPERPNHLTFGIELPKNEIGKVTAW